MRGLATIPTRTDNSLRSGGIAWTVLYVMGVCEPTDAADPRGARRPHGSRQPAGPGSRTSARSCALVHTERPTHRERCRRDPPDQAHHGARLHAPRGNPGLEDRSSLVRAAVATRRVPRGSLRGRSSPLAEGSRQLCCVVFAGPGVKVPLRGGQSRVAKHRLHRDDVELANGETAEAVAEVVESADLDLCLQGPQ